LGWNGSGPPLDPVVDERIERELLSHVLEEVLLSPTVEHAVGDLDVAQIVSAGDHLGLVAVVAQTRDLPQPQLAGEEAHRLVVQKIVHPTPVDPGTAPDEPPLVDATAVALAIGQQIEAVRDHRGEQLRAPTPTVEDDGDPPLAHQIADLAQQPGEGLRQRRIDLSGDQQQGVAGAVVDPVVGAGGHRQMTPRHVRPRRDGSLPMIGAHVAIDVQEAHEMSALIDAQTRKLRTELLGAVVRRQTREPASQRLHLRRPVEPEQSAEHGRVSLLEMLGPLDAQQRHEQERQQRRAQAVEGRTDVTVELVADPKQPARDQARQSAQDARTGNCAPFAKERRSIIE